MDTYSAAKMKFIGKLINDGFTDIQLAQIGHAFDFAMADYSVAEKTTSLVAYNDGIRKDLNNYFIDRRIRGLSEQTIRNQEIFFKGFLEYTGNVPTDSISTVMIEKFLLLKTQSGVSAATVNSYRGFLHSFFAWTTKHHITDSNVAEDVLKRKEAKTLVPHLRKDEIELVREYATNQLDRLYIEFLYATGVRVSDLVQLKKCDIAQSDDDPNVYTVHILHGKGDKERYALLNATVMEMVDNYLDRRTDNNPYLFVSERGAHQITTAAIRVRFRRLAEEIYKATGREISMSPHKWRHTYATDLLRNGMDIVSLQQTLGHSSVSTTQIYARQSLTNAVKDYAKAIQ